MGPCSAHIVDQCMLNLCSSFSASRNTSIKTMSTVEPTEYVLLLMNNWYYNICTIKISPDTLMERGPVKIG